MSTIEFTRAYIHRLCKEIGTTADAIYNERTSAWYFARGSSTIEVFMTHDTDDSERVFIRCFAPICTLPSNPVALFELFRKALELNTRKMGIKLGTLENRGLMCLVAERDIEGMDYQEFVSLISDVGFWADHFDNHFHDHQEKR